MDCSTPGLPVHHQLLELAQTRPLSRWCYQTISSFEVLFSSCLQSFPASGSSQKSQFFTSGGQSFGVSASTSVLPVNIQDWFPLGWTVRSPCSSRDSQGLLQHHSSKASILRCSALFIVQLSHPYMTTRKTIALTRRTFISKVMSLLFNMLVQFSSVTQSCPTLCHPMNRSMPGLPVHHHLPEFTQTPITSWQIDGETMETVRDFIFLGSKTTADGDCSHEIKRRLLLGREVMTT